MSLIRLNRPLAGSLLQNSRCLNTQTAQEAEYTPNPEYPKILDLSRSKKLERKKEDAREAIRAVKTVEEKQIKLNMPKYYGFKCYMLNEHVAPYNSLPLVQHVTRTHLSNKGLPKFYDSIEVDQITDSLRHEIEDAILMHHSHNHSGLENLTPPQKMDRLSSLLCRQLNRVIINNVKSIKPKVVHYDVDYEPRIESFWYAGGMNPPENIKRYRLGQEWQKDIENEPTDRAMQYIGAPIITIRNELPLEPILTLGEVESADFDVPYFQYDPRVVATTTEHRHATNIPGYWAGEPNQFGIISYNNRGYMLERDFGDKDERIEALHRQGILASFGYLSAQANMLGFNTFNDLTYPIVTQTAITNGQKWSFYAYQLNTMAIFGKNITENKLKNICWATEEQELYQEVTDGKVIGFNPDVVKLLIKFYANEPQQRLGVNLRPFLGTDQKVSADYEDDDKRQWLEREYKYLVSNRPRYKQEYEIYLWEKIYKIDNKTRFMEKKLRPFELGIKPSDRTLDNRQANYIPRALRPHLKKNKGRYAKEYFP